MNMVSRGERSEALSNAGLGLGWANRIVGYGEQAPSELLANDKNWRIHSQSQKDALSGVLQEVGIVQNVIVNRRNGMILDGHLRVTLAINEGQASVPITYVDLSEDEERLVLATFDPIGAMAVADKGKLEELLRSVSGGAAIQAMLDDIAAQHKIVLAPDTREDHPEVISRADELQAKWQVQRGQIWLLGKHKVMCGDSTNADDVARLMQGEKARLTWTDPPYGVNYGAKLAAANPMHYRVRQIENDNLAPAELELFIRCALTKVADASLPGAAIYVACPAGTLLPMNDAIKMGSGFDFHWGLVWVKDQLVLGRGDYHFKHENILYGWKPDGAHYFTADRTQTSVFEIPRPKVSDEHPTMKPLDLVARMVENSSKHGDIVLDPFLGSGTTLIAAEKMGRICYGMEIAEAYCAVVLQRWLEFTGDMPRLADGSSD